MIYGYKQPAASTKESPVMSKAPNIMRNKQQSKKIRAMLPSCPENAATAENSFLVPRYCKYYTKKTQTPVNVPINNQIK